MSDTRIDTGVDLLCEFHNAVVRKYKAAGLHDKAAQQKIGDNLIIGSESAKFRARLISEEAAELVTALHSETPEQVLKEVMDLLYVVFGTLATQLCSTDIDEAFHRVHVNNMAKITDGTVREDGKLVKHPDHPKVDLSDLIPITVHNRNRNKETA